MAGLPASAAPPDAARLADRISSGVAARTVEQVRASVKAARTERMDLSLRGRRQIGSGRGAHNSARGVFAALTIASALLFYPASGSVAAVPQRIVSTNLCADESVFRLVARGHIAALSFEAGDRHPVVSTIVDQVAGIPQIRPSTEAVLNYRPDLVVMFAGTFPKLRAHLAALGVPVLEVAYDTSLDGIRNTTRMLGARLGAPAAAERLLADMDRKLAQAPPPRPP